jgi:DivIVA domain-containing protein
MRKEILGYDPRQVDAFLARCVATPGVYRSRYPQLRAVAPGGQRVTPDEIRDVRFDTALLGYRIREIDALLAELHEAVALTTWHAPGLPGEALRRPRTISLVEQETARR